MDDAVWRRPAGSPTGGQFAPSHRAESRAPLSPPRAYTHPAAVIAPGRAGAAVLADVVRSGWPDPEDGTPPRLTAGEVRTLLRRHLPGLSARQVDDVLAEANDAHGRIARLHLLDDSGDFDPEDVDLATDITGDLGRHRDEVWTESDARQLWRDGLINAWSDRVVYTLHSAETQSLQQGGKHVPPTPHTGAA